MINIKSMMKSEIDSYSQGSRIPYNSGKYNTVFLEDYPSEKALIFKLQQRKLGKLDNIAKHVVD